jgi:hypothetical protein
MTGVGCNKEHTIGEPQYQWSKKERGGGGASTTNSPPTPIPNVSSGPTYWSYSCSCTAHRGRYTQGGGG